MILVFIEHSGPEVALWSRSVISAALEAKSAHGYRRAAGLLVGGKNAVLAAREASYYGLDQVYYIDTVQTASHPACVDAAVLRQVCLRLGVMLLLAGASSRAKSFMPRTAHMLGAGMVSEAVAFLPDGAFRRMMYAGSAYAEVEVLTKIKAATIQQSAFAAAPKLDAGCEVCCLDEACPAPLQEEIIACSSADDGRPELRDARVVVSGGRAFSNAGEFAAHVGALADCLGAAVGASRSAVDAGCAPNSAQVGQTGKVVSPDLYVALGISGAIQHLAGMHGAKTVVAVNSDPAAPVFEESDYYLVGDVCSVVPELCRELKSI